MIPEARHQMYLKVMPFNFALLKLDSLDSVAAGRLFGMSHKTIDRAREGGAISSEFMGTALAAFRLNADRLAGYIEIKLDTFFEEGCREDREPATLAEAATNA